MKRRKSKKIFVPGTLITVRGTNCVFMSLGMKASCELESFNGFDISTGNPVRRCDGVVRLATKQECARYWKALRKIVNR